MFSVCELWTKSMGCLACVYHSPISFMMDLWEWEWEWMIIELMKHEQKINCQMSDIDLNESFDFWHTNAVSLGERLEQGEGNHSRNHRGTNQIGNDVVKHVAAKWSEARAHATSKLSCFTILLFVSMRCVANVFRERHPSRWHCHRIGVNDNNNRKIVFPMSGIEIGAPRNRKKNNKNKFECISSVVATRRDMPACACASTTIFSRFYSFTLCFVDSWTRCEWNSKGIHSGSFEYVLFVSFRRFEFDELPSPHIFGGQQFILGWILAAV